MSTDADLRLTPFPARPRDGQAGPRPAVLVLPGGGYGFCSPHEGAPVADWLASLGLHAVVLEYAVAPHHHPRPLAEATAALEHVRAGGHGLDVDPRRVAVLGFSAGGHLAACLSTGLGGGAVPDLSILCYPVISFEHAPHAGSVRNLLGPDPTPAQARALSPDLHVDGRTPPAFLWHTAADDAVDVTHSLRYTAALAAAGVDVELHVYPAGRHGLGLAEEEPHTATWTARCAEWLGDRGWLR
ncbi:acetyl esterase/lipase [Kineococcus xinjiangensis]|uniref:Acetyl esterase/lipase n=1 Tax=Kineococcus xinjiangensis TaxID=512762 RepID=A0A2S6IDZ3_9ACTN|nr:alpha/beta hydrolase [Kineococcus xinjiangensis]PPK92403.1 acetyl esterase/lipase [Kineococcus xinjiangensis]